MPRAGIERIEGARLADFGTFRLGGACRALLDCHGADALVAAVEETRAADTPFVLIGGGSNLLISDHGYDGMVIRFASGPAPEPSGQLLELCAGTALDDAARIAAEAGLEGLTCCTGIPGTVGGAIVGNAGAWGRQIADRLVDVTVLTPDGRRQTIPSAELDFGYRRSRFQRAKRGK